MSEIVATLLPLHPGEVLREEFLAPLGLSPYQLAKAIGVPRTRVERVTREEIGITADTALRLARYFGTSAEFWTGLQTQFELRSAERSLGEEIARIEPLERSAA
ncbi:HigA family addiction module antitoxin [Chthonobacter albigriseus]|uniref:HigA family addiction module antitoxin n=1 Tax=Chthonobacter albigriseus TaxID=1683161 RepID=UPI0015EE9BF4|nr:HigA family addiction module antitoxin [Chthonobacter albigriseus]